MKITRVMFLLLVFGIFLFPLMVRAEENSLEKQIQSVYKLLLGRDVDSEGLAYWQGKIEAGENSLATMIDVVLASDEYKNRFSQFVGEYKKYYEYNIKELYQIMLGREADAEGLDYWVEKVTSGENSLGTLAFCVVDSDEFKMKSGNDAKQKSIEEQIREIYQKMLNREPDDEGFKYWIENILSGKDTIGTLASCIAASEEYKKLNESNEIGNREKIEKQIGEMYETMLGRAPDEEGLKYWTEKILSGENSLATLASSIADSDEYKKRKGEANEELKRSELEKEIRSIYNTMLDREPDEEGFKYWIEKISSGENTLGTLAKCIADSKEYAKKIRERAKNLKEQIRDLYRTMLDREPDKEGFAYWLKKISSGENTFATLVSSILQSEEYKTKNNPSEEAAESEVLPAVDSGETVDDSDKSSPDDLMDAF